MAALCFGARAVGQGNRILLGAIMPTMAAELGLSTVDKGKLLGAFASGYALTQVLGGAAADRVGSKYIMLVALLAVSLGSIAAAALGASDSIEALWLVYFVMGLLEGPSYPATGSMLGQWFPKTEKARAASAADTGGSIGGLLALGAGPVLAASFGWRAALLVFGGASLAFCGLWLAACSDRPASCGWISAQEIAYLRDSGVVAPAASKAKAEPARAFPYRLFGRAPVLAVCYAHVIFNFARYILYGWMPTFYIEVLGVSPTTAGACMTCLQLSDAFTKLLVGSAADRAIASGRLSVLDVRKLLSCSGFAGFAAALLACSFLRDWRLVTAALVVGKGFASLHAPGFKTNVSSAPPCLPLVPHSSELAAADGQYLDLTTRDVGSLIGVGNSAATVSSMLAPMLAGFVVEEAGWGAMFQMSAGVTISGALVFGAFASASSLDDKGE